MKKKQKTAFLDQAEFIGGAECFLLDFFQTLNSSEIRRLNPIVIGGRSEEYQNKIKGKIPIIDFKYPAVKGNFLQKILAVFKLLWGAYRLKKILKKENVTHVFTNTPRMHFIMYFVRFWLWRTRWTAMFHDFTTKPSWLVKCIGRNTNSIIANSIPTRNWLRKNLKKADQKKIRIIENAINFETLPGSTAPQNITNILCLSRIDPRKGQLFFAEAADLLLERNPDLKFTIIGDTVLNDKATVRYEKEIQKFAKTRNLKNLKFEKATKNPLEKISQFDALIFTPTEPETFGRVAIEALALNKLVISFDQTGPKEILKNYLSTLSEKITTEENLLVETGNSMSLAEKIGFFADNPASVKKLTQNAQAFVKKNFNLTETKKRMLEVLLS